MMAWVGSAWLVSSQRDIGIPRPASCHLGYAWAFTYIIELSQGIVANVTLLSFAICSHGLHIVRDSATVIGLQALA